MLKSTKTSKPTRSKVKKSKRGRKAPRMTKGTIEWYDKFKPILDEIHGTHANIAFHKVMKKTSRLMSTLKRRSREYEVICSITLKDIRDMVLRAYGAKCKYCNQSLHLRNMVCDHKLPLTQAGPSTIKNLEMICGRCNTRKGSLSDREYLLIVNWLDKQSENIRNYVNRKLAGRNAF